MNTSGPGAAPGSDKGGQVIGTVSTVWRCLASNGQPPCTRSGVVHLNGFGDVVRARLVLHVSGAEAPHTIRVNGEAGAAAPVLPEERVEAGETVYLTLPPGIVVPGENRIELTDDARPGDEWWASNVRIEVFGTVGDTDGLAPTAEILAADAAAAATRMVVGFTSPYDGSAQEAEIQVPDGYAGSTSTPLVVYAHGRSSVMAEGIDALGSAANDRGWLLASPEMHGSWIVPEECTVYPNDCSYDDKVLAGTTSENSEPKPGAYAYASLESQYDVIGTIRYMIDHYNVKMDQIYLVGYSMGGQLVSVMGAKFPHLFAAVFDNKGPTDADAWYDEQVSVYGTDGANPLRAMRKECHVGGVPKDPSGNPFCYERRSGIEYAGGWIHVPVSITHSVDDALVPVHHSRDLRDAINAHGPDAPVSMYEDTVVGPTCPPYYHCLEPEAGAVLGFLAAYTLNNTPSRVIARADESKAFYWMDLAQSGGAHWSRVEASADPDTTSVAVAVQDDQSLALGINLGTTPIPVAEVGGALQQPGLGFPATTYLIRGGGNERLSDYTSGYLDVNVTTTGSSLLSISAVVMTLVADPVEIVDPQTEAAITVTARDRLDNPVPDGTAVELATTQGTFPGGGAAVTLPTIGGQVATVLTVGPGDTLAEVTATLGQVVASLSIPVSHGSNTAPALDPLPDQVLDEDGSLEGAVDLWAYVSDAESADADLTFAIDNTPDANAGVTLRGDRYVDIRPAADWHGATEVRIAVTDPGGLFDVETFQVTVRPVDDAPVLDPLPDQVLDEDGSLEGAVDLWAYASDAESADADLTFAIDNTPDANAGVTLRGDRYVDIRPAADWHGATEVRISVADPGGLFDVETFQVTVRPVNDAPWIDPRVPDPSADEDMAIVLDLTGYEHDVESSGMALDWTVSGEDNCTVSGEGSGDDRLTFTPDADFDGSDVVRLTLSDPDGGTATQSVVLTWNPVDDAPVLDPLPDQVLDEDGSLKGAIDLWAYASDAESADADLTFVIDNAPDANAGVTLDGDRYVDIRPAADWHGATEVRISVADPGGLFDVETFQVTVHPVNDDPVATDDDFWVQEDSADNLLYPLADDSDVEGDSLTIASAGFPGSRTVRLTLDSTVIAYSPAPDFYGLDSFAYTVTDGNGGSATATITVEVENVNDDPVAKDDGADVLEDSTSNAIYVLDNDTYLPDPIETLSIIHVTPAAHGTVVIALDGSHLRYTPGSDYFGTDVFTYTVADGNGGSTAAAVHVAVHNVNDDPVAGDDLATVDEDTSENWIDVLGNDTSLPDPAETLTIIAVAGAAHGNVTIDDQGTGLRYTPDADYYGADQLRYTISDGNGGLATGTVAVTVENVNDDPVAGSDTTEMDEDSATYPIEVLVNDTYLPDPVESLTIVRVSRAQYGTVTIIDGGTRLTYRPSADFFGKDAFSYTIGDGHGGYDTATVDVTVLGINDPPNADRDSATTQEDTPVTIDVLDNDADLDGQLVPSTVRVVSGPDHGSSNVNSSTGEITYTPAVNWNGNDTLTYRVCDDGTPLPSQCSTAPVSIAVGSVNDPPISDAGPDQDVDTDAHVTLDGSGSTDPDNDLPLLYDWVQTGGPRVALSNPRAEKPTFVAPGDPAVLTFALLVIDSQGRAGLIPDQVVITVHNQPPIADAGPDQATVIGSSVTLDGSGSIDPDHDPLVYLWAQIGGPSITLSSTTAVMPTFIAPAEPAVLAFTLSVTDSFGEPDPSPDQVVIRVREPFYAYLPVVVNESSRSK